jgi:hypothetical protein
MPPYTRLRRSIECDFPIGHLQPERIINLAPWESPDSIFAHHAVTGLAVTGVIIYATRLRSSWLAAAKGISWWGLAAGALIAVALVMAPFVLMG